MRDKIKRVVCFLFVLLVLAANLPLRACALDPVSAATISNAFAQAITAYGASNGVSLTFDGIESTNTEQIGEAMHELWSTFRAGQQTADDWDTLAAAIFPSLYSKAINAAGNAIVAIHIADTYMPDVDDFWNWVLSGPAEMVKVDNAYQWKVDSNTNNIVGSVIYRSNFSSPLPIIELKTSASYVVNNYQLGWVTPDSTKYYFGNYPPSGFSENVYAFLYSGSNNNYSLCVASSGSKGSVSRVIINSSGNTAGNTTYQATVLNSAYNLYVYTNTNLVSNESTFYLPVYSTLDSGLLALKSVIDDGYVTVEVVPYVGDTVANPVPIPDTSDPDYGPLPYIGNLPIPWNDTLFGDGTGTLTDAQSDAITSAIDDAIVANPDKTIEMEGATTDDPDKPTTDDPPSNDPDDYAVPGLQNIFPFCIPFDVYNFLSALAAEPTAPHFTATLEFPAAIGGPQTIDIDFNNQMFNTLAGILRTLELLAFIVGLALLTRSMFIRG